jgi:UDP-N-acetylmuramoyl-tripeptide--D-alanyl-D-alanine ligase
MKIEELYKIYLGSTGVTTDTRKIIKGNVFFALSGENFDGNAFAADALSKGCSHAVVDNKEFALDNRYILVNDCLAELQKLASYHRSQLKIPFIGITGTNGKTTTKELIAAVLSQKYKVLYTQGNLNNHIGVPLTLLRITSDIEIAIIEMGANHPQEIEFLCNIADPNYGLITNIGKAHLEGFGGFEGVKKTKNELYKHLIKHGGTIFANGDNPILMSLLEKQKVNKVFYGNSASSVCKGKNVKSDPYLEFEVDNVGVITTKLAGGYNLENALAAICIGLHFQVLPENIKVALQNYEPSNQRSQIKKTDKNLMVMDYYNANPSSMEAALENFEKMEHPKKAVILGDMLELGSESEFEHRKVINKLSLMKLDKRILVGNNFCSVSSLSSINCFKTSEEARTYIESNPFDGYLILIKGSRGIKLENIVEKIA